MWISFEGGGCHSVCHKIIKEYYRDFPVSPVVKTQYFQCRGQKFDPWSGN